MDARSELPITGHTSVVDLHEFLSKRKEEEYLSVVIKPDQHAPLLCSRPDPLRADVACTDDAATIHQLKGLLHNGSGLPWSKELRHGYKAALYEMTECTVQPVLKAVAPIAEAERMRLGERNSYSLYWENLAPAEIETIRFHRFHVVRKVLAHLPPGFDTMSEETDVRQAIQIAAGCLSSTQQKTILIEALQDACDNQSAKESQLDLFIVLAQVVRDSLDGPRHAPEQQEIPELIAIAISSIALKHRRNILTSNTGSSPKKIPPPLVRDSDSRVSRRLFSNTGDDATPELPPASPSASVSPKKSGQRANATENQLTYAAAAPPETPPAKSRRHRPAGETSSAGSRPRHRSPGQVHANHSSPSRKSISGERSVGKNSGLRLIKNNGYEQRKYFALERLYAKAPSTISALLSKPHAIQLQNFLQDLKGVSLEGEAEVIQENFRLALEPIIVLDEEILSLRESLKTLLAPTNGHLFYDPPEVRRLKDFLKILYKLLDDKARSISKKSRRNASDSRHRAVDGESSGLDSLNETTANSVDTPSSRTATSSTERTPPGPRERKRNS